MNNEYIFISNSLGNITGFIFPFFIKAAMAICVGIGILATAGYAFNELFIRWFPNMGFTLLALGLLLLIGLSGPRPTRICQLIFSGVPFLGIIILSIVGLFSSGDLYSVSGNIHFYQIKDMSSIFSCFVLLMGFEMASTHEEGILRGWLSLKRITMTALIFGFILLFLWGVVTLMVVTPERISDISIPHLIVARTINSVYGREIMGLVIIFGSLGAVNALLAHVSSISKEVLSRELPFIRIKRTYSTLSFFMLVLIIAGLLISGMAGEPEFETFIRGSIYLWLLTYGVIHLALFVSYRKTGEWVIESLSFRHYANLITALFICGLYCGLVLTDPETVLILKFTGIITCGALLLYLFYRGIIVKFAK